MVGGSGAAPELKINSPIRLSFGSTNRGLAISFVMMSGSFIPWPVQIATMRLPFGFNFPLAISIADPANPAADAG